MAKISISLLFVLLILVQWNNALLKPAKKERRIKPRVGKPNITCPDTCALKRRIGKIELRFEVDVTEVKSACLEEINNLRSKVEGRGSPMPTNFTTPTDSTGSTDLDVVALKKNLSISLEEQITNAIDEFKDEFNDGQNKMNIAFDEVKQLAESITAVPEDALRESRQREVDLRDQIDFMNRTLYAIQQQNLHLQRQTQEVRSQSSVLRAQNDILSDENSELQKQSQAYKLSRRDEQRLVELEDSLSHQVSAVNSLEQQLEWLSERVETLSTGIDAAKFEASTASKTAARAELIARKAIDAVKGRKVDVDEVEEPPESDEFRQPDVPPTDCWELYQMGYNRSGVYRIRPWQSSLTFEVFCEQKYNGGGWTMIQKRRDGSVDFDRDWNAYADGFGDLNGEMWLGNDKIHAITNQNTYRLQVLLLDWDGSRAYAEYEGFKVHNSRDYYSLRFGRYSHGTAGDAFRGTVDDGSRNLYLARFTTTDMDNDSCRPCIDDIGSFENCATRQGGGWWFRACSDSNLNGRYVQQVDLKNCRGSCNGIEWRTWRNQDPYSLKATIMLIKPSESRAQ